MGDDFGGVCLRCGSEIERSGRGRPTRWCSQTCRRAAYEARRAARENERAIEVRTVRVTAENITLDEHVAAVLDSPTATVRVMKEAFRRYRQGVLVDTRWSMVWDYFAHDLHHDIPPARLYTHGALNRGQFHPERLTTPPEG